MRKILASLSIFLSTATISLALNFLNLTTGVIQQTIGLGIILLVVLYNRFNSQTSSPTIIGLLKIGLLFFSSLLIQILVISTGSLYSPLFILINLYFAAISLLINFRTALSFIACSTLLLIYYVYFNPTQRNLFQQDPGSALLYLTSLILTIPLVYQLTKHYRLKDQLAQMMGQQIRLNESIFEGLEDLVIVTDVDLHIISINEAVEKNLHTSSSEAIGQPLLEMIELKSVSGDKATRESLSFDQAIAEKSTRIINNFYLCLKDSPSPKKVILKVKPARLDTQKVDQITFVITDTQIIDKTISHEALRQAHTRLENLITQFNENLRLTKSPNLLLQAEIIERLERDLANAIEIEDHNLLNHPIAVEIVKLCQDAAANNLDFAKLLEQEIEVITPMLTTEGVPVSTPSLVKPGEAKLPILRQSSHNLQGYNFAIDPKWLKVILDELIGLSLILNYRQQDRTIRIFITPEGNTLRISLKHRFPEALSNQFEQLLLPYYGILANQPNLKLGTGLEGYLAKIIAFHLNLLFEISCEKNLNLLAFTIRLTRQSSYV